jgi:hypothetical protein
MSSSSRAIWISSDASRSDFSMLELVLGLGLGLGLVLVLVL